jgi:CubicO group peptidase (beta-lactamase class C family)
MEDLERRIPLNPDRLFHIGSISKSFLGLCLVQLQDEGKLDFHKPIRDYLPWLRFDDANTPDAKPITTHHLLTHGGALPDGALFPPDPSFRHRATAAPGTFFHYCNMGYEALGLLLAHHDGGSVAESFRKRLLVPLGMTASEPVITLDAADHISTSYQARRNDRPYPRQGALHRSPLINMKGASGCVAAPARDMGAYLTMLIRRGEGPNGRVVSPAGFEGFMGRQQAAEHFGPGAAYGYGIAVDLLDGHTRLRHTGGMVSFASALEVDMDARCGVFASINAMQGYRPRPVAEYALKLMRAVREGKPLPPVPAADPSWRVPAAADYAGRFTANDGRVLEFAAQGERLFLLHGTERVAVELLAPEVFTIAHADFAHFPVVFTRAGKDGKGAVTEAAWGDDWYAGTAYTGPRNFQLPAAWQQYTGEYRTEDPWLGSLRISARQGKLWLNGTIPLEASGDGRFFLRDEPDSPEWVSFREPVNGKACAMMYSGMFLLRA